MSICVHLMVTSGKELIINSNFSEVRICILHIQIFLNFKLSSNWFKFHQNQRTADIITTQEHDMQAFPCSYFMYLNFHLYTTTDYNLF